MEDPANAFIKKTSISLSRNRPLALIANACTFLGAALSAHLLEKGIQVISIDDLTVFDKAKLKEASKSKDFHLINFPMDSEEILEKFNELDLERMDYGFFITDKSVPEVIIGKGIINFIELARGVRERKGHPNRPRLALISSINLYGKSLDPFSRVLKEAEVKFARGIRHFKLNGRVVRLSEIFGPGMEFDEASPLSLLIQASIEDKLEEIPTSLDFSERSLYIEDAVQLLTKSVLSGSTSNKIYDGALLHPIKLSEIKQILSDPMWFEQQRAQVSKLPPWPTPNLLKTTKELSWESKTPIIKALRETVAYFKEHQDQVPQAHVERKPFFKPEKNWSFEGTGFLNEEVSKDRKVSKVSKGEESKLDERIEGKDFDKALKEDAKKSAQERVKKAFWTLVIGGLIIYGLIWPLIYLGYEAFNIRNHLLISREYLEEGNFAQSEVEIKKSQASIDTYQEIMAGAKILAKIPGIQDYYLQVGKLLDLTEEGVDGVYFATRGSKSLFETTKIISGESREDPRKYYEEAGRDLDFASEKLGKVYAGLSDSGLKKGVPFLNSRIDDLKDKLSFYSSLVEQTQIASELMPKITGLEGKKSYLVLLQNNLELRPAGGFIGSYAKLDFENGTLRNIKVDDIYNLDGLLKEVIAPPSQLKEDLGIDRLYLRDSNFEPDFPTSARQASFFYKKEAGEAVHGVFALDLKASGNLLDAVGGLDLPEYGESVNGTNLFERSISHAEVNFFPGSQAKKNYLTSLQNQMFNKIFYLSKQNWPAIISAISKSLAQKHILVYLEDPALFSYLASSNWSGVFPRQGEEREGESSDFLGIVESNMGANKANYFLQRKINLQSSFDKEGKISHLLKIVYKNTSPSEVFPAGKYKNRIKIYLTLGAKLKKAFLGQEDVTNKFTSFSDYGRTGFTSLIEILPKEAKQLTLEYELQKPLNFKDNQVMYKLEIFKQPGVMADPLDFILNYPINYKLEEKPETSTAGVQEVKIQTDMQTDRVFQFKIKK